MNLNQITIPSLDVTKAVAFYEKLGLILIVNSAPRYVRFQCPNGESTFSIHSVDKLPKGNGVVVYFENDNLETQVDRLQNKGIVFESLPEQKPWLWKEAHLYDLDHNHIILYEAGHYRKNPPWKVKNT